MAGINMVGKGRKALEMIVDSDSMRENVIGDYTFEAQIGPGAVIGSACIDGQTVTVIGNDARAVNPRFRVVYAGIIGLEEAYKMATAVYWTIETDRGRPPDQKTPHYPGGRYPWKRARQG